MAKRRNVKHSCADKLFENMPEHVQEIYQQHKQHKRAKERKEHMDALLGKEPSE